MSKYIRKAQVAGYFYPKEPAKLVEMIERLLPPKAKTPKKAIAIVSPHAGYMYSGYVAAETISSVLIPQDIIILGPNHTGLGAPLSIMIEGKWILPLGEVDINSDLAVAVLRNSKYLKEDIEAHIGEHSIEVQIPIIQYFRRDIRIVPIVVGTHNLETVKELGKAIAKAVKDYNQEVLIIASSDFSHYEPHKVASTKDAYAIDAILKLDEDELARRVVEKDISMCGVMPTIATITASKELGASKAELVRYMTSGDITGDTSQVVGYAGIIIT